MTEITTTKQMPTYLNEEYIKKALEKASDTTIIVHEYEIKRISANGENFCSDIYRVYVKFHNANGNENAIQERMLIVKDMIKHIADIGTNELKMYEEVLPEMENILSKGMGAPVKLKANCLMTDRVDKELYVLEDLNALGYKIADRWLGLDAEHSMVLLKKIAQFHASSMLFVEKNPTLTALLGKSHFANGASDSLGNSIVFGGMKYALSIVEKWDDFAEIAEKMRSLINTFNERIMKLVDPTRSKVNVLSHADLWVNNFLYSYEDGRPKDVVFVDFQNSHLTSPGIDITYFLYTSVQLDVLKSKRFELLRYYYKALKDTLLLCDASHLVPTWQVIMEEVRNCELFGYYAAVCELPICCMSKETSEGFSVDTFSDQNAMLAKRPLMYDSKRVLDTLRYALDHFNELGVLD